MTAQDLKNAILQLAAQGKLVPQDPADAPASELLKHIQAEKSQLAKESKRKKGTPLQPISVDEIPFDIPESWAWVRLGECSSYAQKKEKADKNTIAPDTWSLDLEDIEKGTGRIVRKCLFRDRNISGERVVFQKGQILYSKLRPYLKKVLVAPTDGICSSEIVPFSAYAGINAQYMAYVLTTPHIDFVINSVTYGTKMPRVGTDTMTNLLIPLPPLAEQDRIVAKIEELLPFIEEYDAAEKRLTALNKKFPGQLRKSILQQAIMGKLTERDSADEPACELLKRIQAEKSRLIKEGKLKKEKPLPPITEDEMPFEIPEGWEWVYLDDLVIIRGGKRMPKGKHLITSPTDHIYVRVTDMQSGTILDNDLHYVPDDIYPLIQRYIIEKSDIYLVIVGSTIGKTGLVPEMFDGMNLTENAVRLTPIIIYKEFLHLVLDSAPIQQQFFEKIKQEGQPKLAITRLRSSIIPLPPLTEQQRIVERVEELLAVCGQLK